jgi:hypothetical protein
MKPLAIRFSERDVLLLSSVVSYKFVEAWEPVPSDSAVPERKNNSFIIFTLADGKEQRISGPRAMELNVRLTGLLEFL